MCSIWQKQQTPFSKVNSPVTKAQEGESEGKSGGKERGEERKNVSRKEAVRRDVLRCPSPQYYYYYYFFFIISDDT